MAISILLRKLSPKLVFHIMIVVSTFDLW